MANAFTYSITAANNTSIGGVSIAENCDPSNLNNAGRAAAADIAMLLLAQGGKYTTGGSANAQTLTTDATITAYHDGMELAFVAGFTNTSTSPTLNVDTVGAKDIRKGADAALAAGDITADAHYTVRYDASANSAAGAWMLPAGSTTMKKPTVQVFTASDTWTKPAGCTVARVQLVGGGGGGGGAGSTLLNTGSGGSAGGYSMELLTSGLGTTQTVTIGAGGAGGAANADGVAGGTTSFGALLSATGGGKGKTADCADAAGLGSGGDVNIRGGVGAGGSSIVDGNPYAAAHVVPGGHGGASFFGGGGHGGGYGDVAANGQAYGSGGGGGRVNASAAGAGGDGKVGIVIVEEFYY